MASTCRKCGTPIDGLSGWCISCFRASLKPCDHCMEVKAGKYRAKTAKGSQREIHCQHCNDERWLLPEEAVALS